ncbi:MAG TPA: ComEA family DNA-binding protein [Jatrophihabitans sp.]
MQRRSYQRRGITVRLASVAGLIGRVLGGPASARLDAASPAGLSGARVNPGRRGLLAMAVVTALTVLVAGGWVLAARPHPMLASATPEGSPAGSAEPSLAPGGSLKSPRAGPTGSSGAASTRLVVDVAGRVRRPGVYRLPPGARVDDAVRAAGGFLSGVDPVTVNLARKLVDGEQVLIGVAGSGAAAGAGPAPAPGPAAGAATGALDLNSATLEQLDALPGVGPVLAQHILDWRTQHGRFDSVDQLNGVSGIGDSKFADLKPLVTVG